MKNKLTQFCNIILWILCIGNASAQGNAPLRPSLKDLYGDIIPGASQPLNPLASTGIILADTKAEDWPAIREKILQRVASYFGKGPVELKPATNKFEEIETYKNFGLTHIKYRYQIVDSIWTEAVLVLPQNLKKDEQANAVLTIHGTNGASGKLGVLGVTPVKNRQYAIELAKRGYITFSPDLFGYGSTIKNTTEEKLVNEFLVKYPNWSYRAIKLLTLIRAIDVLEQLPFVKKGAYGSMGNSLGGGMALYHAAIDSRIKVSVPSTGVSPAATNIFRLAKRGEKEEPERWKKIASDGKPPYDIHEVIALCAPRSMLFLDDYNDPYNPDAGASFNHVHQAMQVYQLLGTPNHIAMLIHGDGHDTVDDVREFAYRWFDRWFKRK